MKVRIGITIQGLVQGVAFRYHTHRRATELGVVGWVRNLPDGSVEGLFEGDETVVQALVDWCRRGPSSARVDSVGIRTGKFSGEFNSFEII